MTIEQFATEQAAKSGYALLKGATEHPGIVIVDSASRTVTIAAGAEQWTLEMNMGANFNNFAHANSR